MRMKKMSKSQFMWMIPKSWVVSWAVALMVLLMLLVLATLMMSQVLVCDKSDGKAIHEHDHDHLPLHARIERIPSKGPAAVVLAYWIIGTRGEKMRVMRVLKAIYHPRNHYLLQLDSAASHHERLELSRLTQSEQVFEQFGNVDVVGKSYAVDPMAASGLAAVLHAAALLLRLRQDWDWFLPFTTSDYPLLPQDDILYAFSFLPKDVIFMGYNNNQTSLEKRQNVSQIVVDPSLHLTKKTPILYAAETRERPDAFEIFGGSERMVVSRGLLEHCVNGMDNLPRKLLMYFNNVVFPLQSYFQTVLCNTPNFQSTLLVNNDLRHIVTTAVPPTDLPPAIYATPFPRDDDHRLQMIDEKLLKRGRGAFVPGEWCNQTGGLVINKDVVQPSGQGIKLQEYFLRVVEEKKMASSQCQNYVMH